jgi:hypothetical protein
MDKKEFMPDGNRPSNQVGFITNVNVANAFNKKLDGWPMPQDAFNKLESDEHEYRNAENTKWIRDSVWDEDPFHINKDMFRSNEFSRDHNGKHVLFSGCSVTYGVGLYTTETWSYKIYEKIKEQEPVSGYFNLGKPGTSVMDIVSNVFKYIGLYGAPDVIFLDLPDLNRHYSIRDDTKDFIQGTIQEIEDKTFNGFFHGMYRGRPNLRNQEVRIYVYQYILMLEQYCKDMGIELYIFSYVDGTNDFLKRTDIESMKYLNNQDIVEQIYNYAEDNKDSIDEYFLTARDEQHHGWGYHDIWADIMFKEYLAGGNRYVR